MKNAMRLYKLIAAHCGMATLSSRKPSAQRFDGKETEYIGVSFEIVYKMPIARDDQMGSEIQYTIVERCAEDLDEDFKCKIIFLWPRSFFI